MAFTGIIIFGIIVFIIIVIIRKVASRSGADAGLYKNVALVDWETGYTCDIEIDYSNPASIVRLEEETGRKYVLRKTGAFDKGDKKVFLNLAKIREYHGWTFILNNATKIADDLVREMTELQKENMFMTNLINEKTARIHELEVKMEEEFGKKIKLQEEMNEASRKGIVFKNQNQRS